MKKILRFLLVFAAMFCMTCFTAFAEDTDDPDTYYLELDAAGGQLSGETSTVISSPSAEFTTVDLSKYKPEKDGFTFTDGTTTRQRSPALTHHTSSLQTV